MQFGDRLVEQLIVIDKVVESAIAFPNPKSKMM
jgi:hypothetical protein